MQCTDEEVIFLELKMDWRGKRLFTGMTASGHQLITDAVPEFGGGNQGASPTEMLLGAVIGCTGMDIISILEKMKLTPENFTVQAIGDKAQSHPRRFTTINLHYTISGDIAEEKLYRAIELSLNKYCSVAYSLNATLKASYSLNGGAKKIVELD